MIDRLTCYSCGSDDGAPCDDDRATRALTHGFWRLSLDSENRVACDACNDRPPDPAPVAVGQPRRIEVLAMFSGKRTPLELLLDLEPGLPSGRWVTRQDRTGLTWIDGYDWRTRFERERATRIIEVVS